MRTIHQWTVNLRVRIDVVVYVAIFIIFFLCFSNIPLIQDAWASNGIYNHSEDFVSWIISAFRTYETLNGRIIATVIVGFFERTKWLLDMANALIMLVIIILETKLFDKQKSILAVCLSCLLLISISVQMRTEVYFYALMIYVMPVLLILLQLLFLKTIIKDQKRLLNKKFYLLFTTVSLLNACWLENSSCAYVITFGGFTLWMMWKEKRWNHKLCLVEVLNIFVFCFMILSPGLRSQRTFIPENSFKEMVINNIQNCVSSVLVENKLLCILLILLCINLTFKRLQNEDMKHINSFYLLFLLCCLMLFSANVLAEKVGVSIPNKIYLQNEANFGIILLLCMFIVALPLNFHGADFNIFYFCYFLGIISLVPITVTPNFGVRICYFSTMMLGIIIFGLYSNTILDNQNIKEKSRKMTALLIVFLLCIRMDSYVIAIANIHEIEQDRMEIITHARLLQKYHEWDYNDTVVLPTFSTEQLYLGASPQRFYDSVHHAAFLDYYGLNKNTLVVFSDYEDVLNSEITDKYIHFYLEQHAGDAKEEFNYCIMKDGYAVSDSGWVRVKNFKLEKPAETGNYYFLCMIKDENGEERTIYSARTLNIEENSENPG